MSRCLPNSGEHTWMASVDYILLSFSLYLTLSFHFFLFIIFPGGGGGLGGGGLSLHSGIQVSHGDESGFMSSKPYEGPGRLEAAS